MKLIIVAEGNTASKNIGTYLIDKYNLKPTPLKQVQKGRIVLATIQENVLDLDLYEKEILALKPELVIVASSHKSEVGTPSLTCHTTGNWSSADLGGKPKKLSIAPARYIRACFLKLHDLQQKDRSLEDYEVTFEVTHHSPTIDVPVIFVEVGSSKKQWRDLNACRAVANAIHHIATTTPPRANSYVGFGGGHYAPTFVRRILETNVTFGHICPRHQLDTLDAGLVKQALEKTVPKPTAAVIEWKGTTSEQKAKLMAMFEELGIKWVKDKDLKQP